MPKYSFGFKKKVVEAYLRGEGGYSYLAKKYVELLVLHTLLVQILIHALCAPAVVLGDNGNVHRILTFKNHILVGCLRLQLCDLLCLYCDRFLKCLPLFALGLQCLEGCDGNCTLPYFCCRTGSKTSGKWNFSSAAITRKASKRKGFSRK